MSFSGQSNAPWQRNLMYNGPPPQPQQQQQLYLQQAPPQTFGSIYPPASQAIAYQQPPRGGAGLNPVAFQQPASGQAQQYNAIGTVTKMNHDCGLVNDEVFFYRDACKGQPPKLGDRVIFDRTYSVSGQFKWNATRIQLMAQQPQPQPLMGGSSSGGGNVGNSKLGGSGYTNVPPSHDYRGGQQTQSQQLRHTSPRRSPSNRYSRNDRRDRERIHRSRDREDEEHDRKRRREDRNDHNGRSRERITSTANRSGANTVRIDRDRERDEGSKRDRDRDHSLERKERSDRDRDRERVDRNTAPFGHEHRDKERSERSHHSPHRSSAAMGRRTRTIRRYMVQIPKSPLSYKHADVQELRQRYNTLYIPSDFFNANIKWSQSFTPDNPFSLRRPCQFHIMHRIVEAPNESSDDELEPADADYLYSAKVMLMACPSLADLYQKCFEQDDTDTSEHHTVHPSRLLGFLVGKRGRNEPMAIGGPWSPSLDGTEPDKDPAVLIRTAIRTCKALTGIDLSHCTQWYRFVELHYYRADHKHKEKEAGPPRIETVVIYLPDVHSCMPSVGEWQRLQHHYENAVEQIIARKGTAASSNNKAIPVAATNSKTTNTSNEANSSGCDDPSSSNEISASENATLANSSTSTAGTAATDAADAASTQAEAEDAAVVAADGDGDVNTSANEKNEPSTAVPTHYSKMDLKSMTPQDIRVELEARNLPSKGARNVLMAQLVKAINAEKANETATPKVDMDIDGDGDGDEECEQVTMDSGDINDAAAKLFDETDDLDAEDWADIIDVDLSDIVILDEYDSRKNPEEKEMDENEKKQLMRRYTLPSAPHVVVHPHKTAKGGKFDCSVMSLSVLLDYRPEDTKERFFEVSLFAELFNEMLMRDFGFNIYKELYLCKEVTESNVAESKDEQSADGKQDGDGNAESKEPAADKSAPEAAAAPAATGAAGSEKYSQQRRVSKRSIEEEEQHVEDDNQSVKSTAVYRKRKATSSAGSTSGKERDAVISDLKMMVVKPQLLLSFMYFDTSHCGYIYEKDLEDLFAILGLNLSRGQIRKVLSKTATRHAFYYRKLTDIEESSAEALSALKDVDEIPSDDLKKIALGNKQFEFVFDGGDKTPDGAPASAANDDLITYNGAVVHVGKLMDQIKRTEKNHYDLEKLYNDLRKQHTELQRDHAKFTSKTKDLQSEVKSLNRKISDADQDLYSLNRKFRDQQSTLSYIYNRVSPYFNRDKDKEKDHKSESGRDKDSEKDKDKVKERDAKESKDKEKHKASYDVDADTKGDEDKEKNAQVKLSNINVDLDSANANGQDDGVIPEPEGIKKDSNSDTNDGGCVNQEDTKAAQTQ